MKFPTSAMPGWDALQKVADDSDPFECLNEVFFTLEVHPQIFFAGRGDAARGAGELSRDL